ncbi:MAG: tail fiber domain-containing protein, partial [Bacteroidota bacterium]
MKNITKYTLAFLILNLSFFAAKAQVAINENGNNPDASAILDISSTDKGLLIPRMDSMSRNNIVNPAEGLMVFDSTTNSFWYYVTDWLEVGKATLLADTDGDTKIQVEKNTDEDLIRFDVAGTEFMRLDSGRIEILNTGRSIFLGNGAGANDDYSNNQNLFLGDSTGYNNTNGRDNIFQGYQAGYSNTNGDNNIFLGREAGYSNTDGNGNLFMGFRAGDENTTGRENIFLGYATGGLNTTGRDNIFIGYSAGSANTVGDDNIFLGYNAGDDNTIGKYNMYIGTGAGQNNPIGNENVFLGHEAGNNASSGSRNVFIGYQAGYNESDSSKLYIENSSSNLPLIFGDFEADSLQINGKLNVNGAYNFPTTDGLADQVLSTDGSGNISWADNNSGAFTSANGITSAINNSDDFLFGADELDNTSGMQQTKFFFDKAQGAFRVGSVLDDDWDQDSLGLASIGMGTDVRATGTNAIAMGSGSNASGSTSTAIGNSTTASGNFSVALGASTEAGGNFSTAMGFMTTAGGQNATALGSRTEAPSYVEIATGVYNTDYAPNSTTSFDEDDRLFVIGNGESTTSKSDALLVYKNGNTEINGLLTVDPNNDDMGYTFPPNSPVEGQLLRVNSSDELEWSFGDFPISNERLNERVTILPDALDKLDALHGYYFYWKSSTADTSRQVGVMAQELEQVLPELVHFDSEGYRSVDYASMAAF